MQTVILEQKADRRFRTAAYWEPDARRKTKILRETLAEFKKVAAKVKSTYCTKWEVLIRMSVTLRSHTYSEAFSAAFDNDVQKETPSGKHPCLYAATSPLRQRFLELCAE